MKFPDESDLGLDPSNYRFKAELARLRHEWADKKAADMVDPPKRPRVEDFMKNSQYVAAGERYYYLYQAWQRKMMDLGIPVELPRRALGWFR